MIVFGGTVVRGSRRGSEQIFGRGKCRVAVLAWCNGAREWRALASDMSNGNSRRCSAAQRPRWLRRNVVELSHCDLVDEIVRDDVHRLIELMAADASS